MDFGKALGLLKDGKSITRTGWNGKGMYLYMCYPEIDFGKHLTNPINATMPHFIMFKTADNNLVPWVASQTDILANDWEILIL